MLRIQLERKCEVDCQQSFPELEGPIPSQTFERSNEDCHRALLQFEGTFESVPVIQQLEKTCSSLQITSK